jgi:hypothetical protein
MPLMCEDCFEQYNIKRRSGLYCKECDGNLVEIDENFIEAIILLNKKGYYTMFCCAGHPNPKDVHSAYIMFEDGSILPYLPKGYLYDKDLTPNINYENSWDKGYGVRIYFKNDDLPKLQKEILESAINVLDWAISLPDRNDNNYEKE